MSDQQSPPMACADPNCEVAARLRDLQRALDEACVVVWTDAAGVITEVNDHFCRLSGYGRDELIGRTHAQVNSGLHPKALFQDMWGTISGGQVWRGELCNRRKDGSLYWTHTVIVPFLDAAGRPDRYLAIRRDITERKRAEDELARAVRRLEDVNDQLAGEQARLIQAEKLSSVALLAGGVAHEINNPLGGVMACVHALRHDKVPEGRRATYFDTVVDGLERIRSIVSALTRYAQPAPPSSGAVYPSDLFDEVLEVIGPTVKQRRLSVLRQPGDAPPVDGDHGQLVHALVSVTLNALDASPARGTVSFEAVADGDLVGLRVSDQGPGIAADIVDRVCDPFFSTKAEGEGTGLGLSVVLGVVRAHGGRLQFGHGPGGGAAVTLWLPAWRSGAGRG